MKNVQEQDIWICIPLERKLYGLQLSCETFFFVKQFESSSGLKSNSFTFWSIKIAKKNNNKLLNFKCK